MEGIGGFSLSCTSFNQMLRLFCSFFLLIHISFFIWCPIWGIEQVQELIEAYLYFSLWGGKKESMKNENFSSMLVTIFWYCLSSILHNYNLSFFRINRKHLFLLSLYRLCRHTWPCLIGSLIQHYLNGLHPRRSMEHRCEGVVSFQLLLPSDTHIGFLLNL